MDAFYLLRISADRTYHVVCFFYGTAFRPDFDTARIVMSDDGDGYVVGIGQDIFANDFVGLAVCEDTAVADEDESRAESRGERKLVDDHDDCLACFA